MSESVGPYLRQSDPVFWLPSVAGSAAPIPLPRIDRHGVIHGLPTDRSAVLKVGAEAIRRLLRLVCTTCVRVESGVVRVRSGPALEASWKRMVALTTGILACFIPPRQEGQRGWGPIPIGDDGVPHEVWEGVQEVMSGWPRPDNDSAPRCTIPMATLLRLHCLQEQFEFIAADWEREQTPPAPAKVAAPRIAGPEIEEPSRPVSLKYASKHWFPGMGVKALKSAIDAGAIVARQMSTKRWVFEVDEIERRNAPALRDADPQYSMRRGLT